ncbi:MAG: iron-sulfur cluster repair di-iron protein [Brumimicrobium sp.]|nr:iron-sulfur cluster repair di-iron protein [Brumimicrobium sp.]
METQDVLLDATAIQPHALKHEIIFSRFDSLKDGEYFILHNDHDPIPLYHHFKAIHGETFDWEYLEKGPLIWEVQITRHLPAQTEPTVGDMVADDYRRAEVFRKYGIDFCCNGNVSLQAVCDKQNLNYETVKQDLDALDSNSDQRQNTFNNWELDFLSDYIIHNHHTYVRNSIPMLNEFTQKVANVHGAHHPEVVEIAEHWAKLAQELTDHMAAEEKYLFPYVKKLVHARNNNEKLPVPGFGSIDKPIQHHLEEHDSAGQHMKRINELSNGFKIPEDACNTYSTMYKKLDEFEKDLFQHIHLENNILFHKAIEMEKQVVEG